MQVHDVEDVEWALAAFSGASKLLSQGPEFFKAEVMEFHMQMTRRKQARDGGDKSIRFPLMECWSPITKTAIFVAEIGKERLSCRVPLSILCGRFAGSADDPMQAVKEHRLALHAAAVRRIEQGDIDSDETIVLREEDFLT